MTQIPLEIQQVLLRFQRWIRRYILLEGMAILVALACVMFWVTLLLDVVYFRMSNLELPSSFRLLALMTMVAVLTGVSLSWVLLRLFRKFRTKDLALALERKFPQLRDQLITTVEMEDETISPIAAQMLEQTSREAAQKVSKLPLEETFNQTPLKRLSIVATVLFCTLAVFGVASGASVERWVNAYLLTQDNYWDPYRKQALTVKILAQPGERVKDFDEQRVYRHPRGADLQLLVESHENAISPEEVIVQYISLEGNRTERGRANMNRSNEGRFRHSFSRVVNDLRIWVRGGDFVNRTPYRIQIVDPPQINTLSLKCDYPTYTGMDGLEDRIVPVVGTHIALPMETEFDLQATANKKLRFVDIRCERFSFSFGFRETGSGRQALPATLVLRDKENRIVRTVEMNVSAGSLLTESGTGFNVPFLVSAQAEQKWAELGELAELPFPILPDSQLKIYLEDDDEIYSPEPSTLNIQGIVDQPPVIETRRTGIGSIVTRNASIPIEGKLIDDYGLVKAWYGYKIGSAESDQLLSLSQQPSGQKVFLLNDESNKQVERFNLRPLKLQEGETLTLAIYAEDGDALNGPHTAHGEFFTFKIVTDDELLMRMFDREVNLRLRFEQIRAEFGELRKLLAEQIENAVTLSKVTGSNNSSGGDPEQGELSAFIERSLHQLRKNHTESRSIEVSFQDLREEMVNNGIDTKDKLDRIDLGVIAPLVVLNNSLFVTADQRYAQQRLKLQRKSGVLEAFQETLPAVDAVIVQMDRILEEMKDRGTINDVIQNLQGLIEKQRKLLKEVDERRIQENFFFDVNQ